ncbi:MAG: DNA-binding response regulator [Candidatus Omnitrophota bacterium]|jgi:two-component system LytT family response regulator|nr:MAG: DNA-binding response regulator [Candidatus Omnitrophota bacterium]
MNGETIRALIIDDEPLARKKIRTFLDTHPEIEITAECENGVEAVRIIQEWNPDLIFLDIQMPELDGFGLIRVIGAENMPAIIFVTAFDQYAIQAFESHAVDYLLKPFNQKRFHAAVERAIDSIQLKRTKAVNQRLIDLLAEMEGQKKSVDRIVVKTSSRILFVKTEDIDWIGASGNYLEIHSGKNMYLIRETMNHIEQKLDPARFLRIHRSTIVNLDRVIELQADTNGDYVVIMQNGITLTMSRSHREKMNKRIGDLI